MRPKGILEPTKARLAQSLSLSTEGRPLDPVRFHVRDIPGGRAVGQFESESLALASLKGGPDGHFSINNHRGAWCEVEVRGGERFIRRVLMVSGDRAAYTNIDS